MKYKAYWISALLFALVVAVGCKKDPEPAEDVVEYDDTAYTLEYGNLPNPEIALDNSLTVQGVKLGRMLFYEPLLSQDGTQSCASCHRQVDSFSDTAQFSIGVAGLPGGRQAMPIFNMAWHTNQFFWDGRANLLRDQSILPIQDPLEMNETLENVVSKLSNSEAYSDQFIRAFGNGPITSVRVSLALEQFMNSIVSYDSKYDRVLAGQGSFTESEARGLELFEAEYNPFFPDDSGADCAHCHGGLNFLNNEYMNNGLDTDAEFADMGRENATDDPEDRAKFKVPSLRNIELSGPYMHDGRFQTLEEVVNHYNSGIQESTTADETVLNTMSTGLLLTDQDKEDLINFLKTLTDESYLSNPEYASPF